MSAHTPGPWSDDDGTGSVGSVVTADQRTQIAQASQLVGDNLRQERRMANARLIAAAPDLLAAAEAVIAWLGKYKRDMRDDVRAPLLDAIAKARGSKP